MKQQRFNWFVGNCSINNLLIVFYDAIMASASFALAFYIRLGDEQMVQSLPYLYIATPIFSLICVSVFICMRLYRGVWKYASMRDLRTIIKAVTISILVFALLTFLYNRMAEFPRSVLFINWLLLVVLLGGSRFAYRIFRERNLNDLSKIPVLLIGAGDSAEQFIRNSQRDNSSAFEVVGLVDDNPTQKGRTIHRVPIYGDSNIIANIVRKLERKGYKPQKLIVSDDDISGDDILRILDIADSLGIPLARLPKISELKHGFSEKINIRPIAVEDLLGRSQNTLDRKAMRELLEGKLVLITGAGGTIGGELTRQIASYNPSKLVVVELSEFNLYQIERELLANFPELPMSFVLCDVRDEAHIDSVFAQYKPEFVFHAAAIKHVPIAEYNIEETILTNVFGSKNVAEACLKYAVQAMVMISTDKAVNPTNVMGASKRLAESFCQALGKENSDKNTKFIIVRFGNVLGSTGSVVPLFNEQLANGGPITVTDPEMTRYFMTVREAVELVLQASILGRDMGEKEYIFVLDMGQPMKILDLALKMIRLAGLQPYKDIDIKFTGLRAGEKLYEELFHSSENSAKTLHNSIFLASPRQTDWATLQQKFTTLYDFCKIRNSENALATLTNLVPEFTPRKQ